MTLGTSVDLLSVFDYLMLSAGMQRVSTVQTSQWPASSRVYEDRFSIIGCFYYDSFSRLSTHWLDAQDLLVSLMSASLAQGDAKSWDGYLILLTNGSVSRNQALKLTEIRSNTRRVRKIVITGDDLRAPEGTDILPQLRRNLGPVLPLTIQVQPRPSDPLASLAERLGHNAARSGQVAAILEAYREGRPVLTALHDYLELNDGTMKGRWTREDT